MIDIDKYIETVQINWVKKLTNKIFANWKVIPFYYFNMFGFLCVSVNNNKRQQKYRKQLARMIMDFFFAPDASNMGNQHG